MESPHFTPWPDSAPPTRAALWQLMTEQGLAPALALRGLAPYAWSNAPHDVYSAHAHTYHKVIYVVEGSITFGLPQLGTQITLNAGDRLDLPAGVTHDAQVGARGVTCLEAQNCN